MNAVDLLAALRGAVAAGDRAAASDLFCEYVELIARRPLPEHRRYACDMVQAFRSMEPSHGEGHHC